jgi:hypothetical protein
MSSNIPILVELYLSSSLSITAVSLLPFSIVKGVSPKYCTTLLIWPDICVDKDGTVFSLLS